MTKKHYVEIAALIKRHAETFGGAEGSETRATFHLLASEIAGIMANENPHFDRGRFLAACGF